MNARLALPVLLVLLLAGGLWVVFGSDPENGSGTPTGGNGNQDPSLAAGSLDGQSSGTPEGDPTRTDLTSPSGSGDGSLEALATSTALLPSFTGVLQDTSGKPIPEASVVAYGMVGWAAEFDGDVSKLAAQWETTTDAEGRFAFPATPRDRLRFLIEFRHPDFAETSMLNQPAGIGRTRDLGTVTMGIGFSVEGTVFNQQGAPLAGARVTPHHDSELFRFTRQDPSVRALLEPTFTDGEGRFRIDGLPQGSIRIRAEASLHLASWSSSIGGRHGETVDGIEIQLGNARPAYGLVLDELRNPLVDARVVISTRSTDVNAQGQGTTETTTDAAGRFELPVPEQAEQVTITIGARGYWVEEEALEEGALKNTLEYTLTPIEPLTGLVVDEAGRGLEGAVVRLVENRQGQVNPKDMLANAEVRTAADGSFSLIPNLRSAWGGRFTVYAWDANHAPKASAMFRLRSPERYKAPDLDFILLRGFQAFGTVVTPEGDAVANAQVHLRKLRKPRRNAFGADPGTQRGGDIFAYGSTDADGRFAFPGLAEGDYRLEAFYPGYSPVDSDDFGIIDSDHEAYLKLHSSCGIAGRVEGPVERFRQLRVTANAPGFDPLDANVAADGSFTFEGILPGTWNLQLRDADQDATGSAFAWGNSEALARLDGLEVPAGVTVPAVLQMDLSGRSGLTGKVQVDGKPAADYVVFVLPQIGGANSAEDPFGGRNLSRQMRVATTDYAGKFALAALPSGDFWVLVCRPGRFPDNLHGGDSAGPTGLQRREVLLRDGTDASVDFDLQLGDLILQPENPGGGRNARVRIVPQPEDGRRSFSFQLRSREHTLRAIPSGAYQVLVRDQGTWRATSISVFGGGEQRLPIVLPQPTKSTKPKPPR